jgi:D-sedoheptulose 7-phosphate isomerase
MKDDVKFLDDYFSRYREVILGKSIYNSMIEFKTLLSGIKETGNKMILAGNGASASIASHSMVDFTKQAKVKAVAYSDYSLITAFANDYGYENYLSKILESYANKGDVVVLISSSGKSSNIVNAAQYAKDNNIKLITFTGFEENNPLKLLGDINFWVDSKAYNIIENTHSIWLMAVCDLLMGKIEYSVS